MYSQLASNSRAIHLPLPPYCWMKGTGCYHIWLHMQNLKIIPITLSLLGGGSFDR